MASIANQSIRGERKVKLRINDPLHVNSSTIELIDCKSGQAIDGVTSVTLPLWQQGRTYWAEVTLYVTDIEVVPTDTVKME